METPFAIEAQGLCKSYPVSSGWRDAIPFRRRERRKALVDVDFRHEGGRVLGLLGANGAGKTTLIKLLSTTLLPDAGRCEVHGVDVLRQPNLAKRHVGLVVNEERSFYFRLSLRQNLRFFASLWNLHGQRGERRVDEVLRIVGLEGRADDRFDRLSTGMKQRLAIARGLLVNPRLLLLDEPTRSLDPVAARQIRAFVREELVRKEGKTAVLASNNLEEIQSLADDLLVLREGRVLARGSLHDLRREWGEGLDGLLERMAPDEEEAA